MKQADEIWKQMERSHAIFLQAFDAFLTCTKEQRIEAIRANYQGNRRLVVLMLLEFVAVADLKELLTFLLSHSISVHQYLFAFRAIILRIPRDWLAQNIETAAEPFLKEGDDETFRRFLELYFQIDSSLTRRLAERAVASSDADTREAGADFLEKLTG
jgi:hypothetical protein